MSFLDQILPSVYRCAESPDNWFPVLDSIRKELEMESVVVQVLRRDSEKLQQLWQARDSKSESNADMHDRLINNADNPRFNLKGAPPLLDSCIIDDEPAATAHCPDFTAFRERLNSVGLGKPTILGLTHNNDTVISFVMHQHVDDQRDLSQDMPIFLNQFSPHLKQTISLCETIGYLQEKQKLLSHALDQFNSGVIILNQHAEVTWMNEAGKQIIRRSHSLSINNSKLRCQSPTDQHMLSNLIHIAQSAIVAQQRYITTLGKSWGNPLQVLCTPLPRRHPLRLRNKACVVLYLSEQMSTPELSPEEVVGLFGLTPAEARLAVALSQGESLAKFAANRSVSVGTARIQLKSIFSKLGINRQPELVHLISSSISARTIQLAS